MTYTCFVCNDITIFGCGYWGQMAKLGVTGGFSVVPISPLTKKLAQMLSATGKPISVYSGGVNWKQNKKSPISIFLVGNIWEGNEWWTLAKEIDWCHQTPSHHPKKCWAYFHPPPTLIPHPHSHPQLFDNKLANFQCYVVKCIYYHIAG